MQWRKAQLEEADCKANFGCTEQNHVEEDGKVQQEEINCNGQWAKHETNCGIQKKMNDYGSIQQEEEQGDWKSVQKEVSVMKRNALSS